MDRPLLKVPPQQNRDPTRVGWLDSRPWPLVEQLEAIGDREPGLSCEVSGHVDRLRSGILAERCASSLSRRFEKCPRHPANSLCAIPVCGSCRQMNCIGPV